jgi:hypothetical protein
LAVGFLVRVVVAVLVGSSGLVLMARVDSCFLSSLGMRKSESEVAIERFFLFEKDQRKMSLKGSYERMVGLKREKVTDDNIEREKALLHWKLRPIYI